MASYLSLLVIALAVSLDGCSVGLLYGTRRIRIPLLSLFIIAVCSGVVIAMSMKAGQWLSGWLEPDMAKIAGAVILVVIGFWAITQFFMQSRKEEAEQPHQIGRPDQHEPLSRSVVIQILRSPSVADIDKSGNISTWEASLLGLALSLDAFGAGIGAAMMGYPAVLTAILIAVVSGSFIAIGLRLGRWAAGFHWARKLSIVPGFLLIAMGIIKLL